MVFLKDSVPTLISIIAWLSKSLLLLINSVCLIQDDYSIHIKYKPGLKI